MIMVDVYVPAVDREYDFSLDQNVEISLIIEEISEMIAYKEHSEIVGSVEELVLCDRENGRILEGSKTLCASRIQTGSKLMLV
ncbi:MAG: hypothetical protein HDR28_08875 [Lachnospiraceae bacterium]|nr:hypothetical protein [Lachnospiraceae bacterium]